MTICSPKAGNIEGEQILIIPSYKGNNCFIILNSYIYNSADSNDIT